MELQKPVTSRECYKDCESKICVLSDWSDWSECPQDSCINGNYIELVVFITYTSHSIAFIHNLFIYFVRTILVKVIFEGTQHSFNLFNNNKIRI